MRGSCSATLEKVRARIAVSEEARRTVVEHLGGDAVLVPNGVDVARFAGAPVRPEWSGPATLAFLGRVDEPRKGLEVLLAALPGIVDEHPAVRLLVAGPGETDALDGLAPDVRTAGARCSGGSASRRRPSCCARSTLYVAPHIGGESFGIVLLEAMSAGTAVLASDLVAFRDVLDGGRCGELFTTGDAEALVRGGVRAARRHPTSRPSWRRSGTSGLWSTTGPGSPARSSRCTRRSPAAARRCARTTARDRACSPDGCAPTARPVSMP